MQRIRASITGTASFLPDYVLTNDELSKMMDTTDEWIMTRIGVKERRIAKDPSLVTSEMGAMAVGRLLDKMGVKPEEIDALICTTSTPDYIFPSTASIIAEKCGIKRAFSYDIKAACSGFVFAMELVSGLIQLNKYKRIIVVSAEKMSWMTDYTDRSTAPIFGDAAAAVMIEPTTEDLGIMDCILRTDGVGLPHLHYKGGGVVYPASHESVDAKQHFIHQEGKVVFKHAVEDMASVAVEIMEKNNLTYDMIDWVVPHQANIRIIDATAKRMGLSSDKVMVNIQHRGNTSSASIPLCLSEWEGQLKKGDNLILAAFGGGFTWGAVYLKWAYNGK